MTDELAKKLRANATEPERRLWAALREARRSGLHFRRQVPIGTFIVDFACHRVKVIVELDGSQHGTADAVAYDEDRTEFLRRRGYRVIRFWNHEILKERARVVETIVRLAQSPHPKNASHFSTSPRGGREK
jgi:very-short-patch-repair endonuclease